MADRVKGITVEIGGDTTGLKKALGGVNSEIRNTQSDLRDVERLLRLDPTNTELLAQKQRLLSGSIEKTTEKLSTLKEAQRQMQQQMAAGKGDQEKYDRLQREIIETEQNLKKLEDQAKKSNVAISKIDEVSSKVASGAGKIAGVAAPLTAGIAGVGVVAFNAASEIQDAMGACEQVFKAQSTAMLEWSDNIESYYGIAKGEAITYANTMGAMLQNIGGLTEEQAAKQAQTLIELAGDLTAMYGGTTQEAVYALTGALKGNNTMLDNYGMAVNESLIKTKAFEMGLISEGQQIDLAAKQAATLALIMEQSAAAQGQAAREADGASGSIRAAKTEMQNLTAEIGENLIPIITPLIQKVSEAVQWFNTLSAEGQSTLLIILALVAAISPVAGIISAIATIVPIATTAFAALNAVMVANPVGAVMIGIIALIAVIQQLWEKSEAFRTFVTELWENLKTAFSSFVSFIETNVQKIGTFFTNLWKGIVNGAKSALNTLINGINRMIAAALGPLNELIAAANVIPGVNIPKLHFSIPNIPMLAKGGTVLKGSAIVGEAGPELLTVTPTGTRVIPLTSSGGEAVKGAVNATFNITGYSANEGNKIATIINRELGRIYG